MVVLKMCDCGYSVLGKSIQCVQISSCLMSVSHAATVGFIQRGHLAPTPSFDDT